MDSEPHAVSISDATSLAEAAVWKRLERAAFAAWPAAEVEELDGWRLRAMQGVSRRANSTWTCCAGGALTLEARLDRLGQFYAARELPARLYVCPVSEPAGLDEELERRGFVREESSSVYTATPERVLALARRSRACAIEPEPSATYRELAIASGRYSAVPEIYAGLLSRVAGRAGFAWVGPDEAVRGASGPGQAASVALVVRDGCELGLFSMATRPSHRRQGYAESLIGGVAARAAQDGVETIFLQVEVANMAARRLYERCGFVERYRYHYRTRAHR